MSGYVEDFEEDFDIFGSFEEDSISDRIAEDVDVEKIVAAIRKCSREVDFLKKLKASRVKPIDEKIATLTSNQDKLKQFAISLMGIHFPNQNTVDFPGVGKLTKRKTKGKWEVTDEEAFLKYMKEQGKYDDVVTIKESVNKRELPKVLSEILKTASEEDIVGASFVEPESDVSLVVKLYDPELIAPEEVESDEIGF